MTHMLFHPTGSLVIWRRAQESSSGPGLVIRYEKMKSPLFPGTMGAWIQWTDRDTLMWSALSSIKFLVQSGSIS
ncbi:MAG TPA: hypothetical protein DEQ32_15510 [Gammaproteobacteria bacterium]|nr:hypothetical protein [Gammaproteobacteria bacterium]